VQDAAKAVAAEEAPDSFDPVIVGPWMDLWDIEEDARRDEAGVPKPNQHVDRYMETPEELRDPQAYIAAGNW